MFGLRQQIGGYPGRVGVGIRDDHRFGRACQAVQTDQAVDLLFGQGYEQVTRPDDFIHAGDALRTKGQGGNRLRSTHLVDSLHTAQVRRGQDGGVRIGGSADDDFGYASHLGRDGGHEQRRRQWGCAARYVDPGAFHRGEALPYSAPQALGFPVGQRLQAVEGANAFGGGAQRLRQLFRQRLEGPLPALRRDAQFLRCGPVEQRRPALQSGVAFDAHRFQNFPYSLGRRHAFPEQLCRARQHGWWVFRSSRRPAAQDGLLGVFDRVDG